MNSTQNYPKYQLIPKFQKLLNYLKKPINQHYQHYLKCH
jgi:hypothetical protein